MIRLTVPAAFLFGFSVMLASTAPIAGQVLFDGSWTVTIRGQGGECLKATSISLTVKDGRITFAGAQGVGRAATRSVVISSLLIILLDVLLIKFIFFIFPETAL